MNLCLKIMSEKMDIDQPDQNIERSFGCVFCLTGKEVLVAQAIEVFCREARARAVCQEKRFSSGGQITVRDEVMIKGYVFFVVPRDIEISKVVPPDDLIKPLTYSGGDWRLSGEDEEYAKWIFKYDGTLCFSKAYQIGDRIEIIDGPLKDLEGQITKIDKRNQNGQVTFQFAGREQKLWLGFEVIKKLPSR